MTTTGQRSEEHDGDAPAGATADGVGPSVPRDGAGGTTYTAPSGDAEMDDAVSEREAEGTFDRTVDEGRRRLARGWSALIAVGLVGGADVGLGVLALLYIENETGSTLLGGLGFSIGFIALTIAGSELFTEDFLVPVTTVIAREGRFRDLMRLWSVTLLANLAGGFLITYLMISGFPELHDQAITSGSHYVELGLGWRAFSLALLGGAAITLMTYMQLAADDMIVRIIPAVAIGFLLAGTQLNHAVVNSLLMFSGLHTGRSGYGWTEYLQTASFAALGNVIGGIGLVTVTRLLRVPHKVRDAMAHPAPGVTRADQRRRRAG